MTRIVFAYDGSAAATAAIAWMRDMPAPADAGRIEVVTLTLDLGQRDELDAARERALAAGAVRAHVLDVRESFAHDYLLPALRADAACDEGMPMGRALSRPLIARQLVEVARMEGAAVIAYGGASWRAAEERERMERSIRAIAPPSLVVLAPLAEWSPSDEEIDAFAQAHSLRLPKLASRLTADVWGRCARVEGMPTADAEETVVYTQTKAPQDAPETPAFVDVTFEQGAPVGISGVGMPLLEIISSLETIAGAHGVGRSEALEASGLRLVCEGPAATVLDIAHRALERAVLPADVQVPLAQVRVTYREIVRRGTWSSLAREAAQAFIDRVQAGVTGTVTVKLSRGTCRVVAIEAVVGGEGRQTSHGKSVVGPILR